MEPLTQNRLMTEMTFFEVLPEGCPPKDGVSDAVPDLLYRAVRNNPTISGDFLSKKAEKPHVNYEFDECEVRSVSLFSRLEDCQGLAELPRFKNKGYMVASLSLRPEDGVLKQTGGETHYSWWRSILFDPSVAIVMS